MSFHSANTLFLRLEGPLQAWGDNSKFVVRRSMTAPTKSGVLGLLCCAMGLSRQASRDRLARLNQLDMAVRIDRPGILWQDYHTVGAGIGILKADGKGIKRTGNAQDDPIETLITRRYYLCDASFLVVLQGDPTLIAEAHGAVSSPRWPIFLGRKCCPPSRPLTEHPPLASGDLLPALAAVPWKRRCRGDSPPQSVECLLDWRPWGGTHEAPDEAEVWYDVPESFDPPVHHPRFVIRKVLGIGPDGPIRVEAKPAQTDVPPPPRPRADYGDSAYRRARAERLRSDRGLCVFCKSPATTVQHVTYRRAGGEEGQEDLRSLCKLCHDAATMIEYGLGMGLDRINPEEPRWRDRIIAKRNEIIRFRSLETRRRRLTAEEDE